MWWLFRDYVVRKAKLCHLGIGKLQHSSRQPGKEIRAASPLLERWCSLWEARTEWPNWNKLWWFSHVNPCCTALLAFIWSVQNTAHLQVLHIWSLPLLGWLGSVLGAETHRLCPTASLTACLCVWCSWQFGYWVEMQVPFEWWSLQLPTDLTHEAPLPPQELCCLFCVFTEVLSSLSLIILSPCGS